MTEKIFGLLFGANAHLLPSQDEVEHFLSSPKKSGARSTHRQDFAQYSELLQAVSGFERDRTNGAARSAGERMFFGALSHSGFFTLAVQSTITLYKFYLHALLSLDFRKPLSFIAAAEKEIAGLNPNRKKEADKLEKLRSLIDDRKMTLKVLEQNRDDLMNELKNIALYMGENLNRVTMLCEKAIVLLVHLYSTEEQRLLWDIKSDLQYQLSGDLHGPAAQNHVEPEHDIEALYAAVSSLLRDDVYALSDMYEAIREHTMTSANRLHALIMSVNHRKGGDDKLNLFENVEEVLISLVSNLDIAFKRPSVSALKSEYSALLRQKREELVASFLDYVRKERRARNERRAGRDRRTANNPNYAGPQRRIGDERRSGKSRRRS